MSAAPRILFLATDAPDYLSDSLLHGLRALLGSAVVDVPRSDRAYRDHPEARTRALYGRGFTLYGLLAEVDVERTGALAGVHEGRWDLVVLADVWSQAGQLIALRGAPCAVAVLDGADSAALFPYTRHLITRPWLWMLPRPHRRWPYFKRELTRRTAPFGGRRVRPISFSVPEEKIVAGAPAKDRLLATHVVDPEVAALEEGCEVSYAFADEAEYQADLRRSRFAVTTKRAGWDCLRHYEIAAAGTVPCFRDLQDKPPRCAPHGLDESNCVIYSDPRELLERIRRMPDEQYERLRAGALSWARANTTRERARWFLAELGVQAPQPPRER